MIGCRSAALTVPALNGARKPNTTVAVLRFTTFAFSRAAVFCLELFARMHYYFTHKQFGKVPAAIKVRSARVPREIDVL